MMAFFSNLLRIVTVICFVLLVLAGATTGWFFDTLPMLQGLAPEGGTTLATRVIGVVSGAVAGLLVGTLSFGIIATLLDIRDKLTQIRDHFEGGSGDGRALRWEK